MNSRRPGLSPNSVLVALAICMALQMTGYVMFLPLFARRFESFGSGVEALGTSAMAFALTSTVAAPFMGMLADRFGRRPIVLVSLLAYVLAFAGYLLAESSGLLIFLRGLAGAFTAGLIPAVTSIVGDLAPEARRAQWIGIVNGGASAGWIVGPLLGGLLYDHYGYVVPFSTSIGMAAAALLIAAFFIHETGPRDGRSWSFKGSLTPGWRRLPARRTMLLLMLISLGVMFAWAFVEPQFMFYAYDDLSWSSSRLGLVMSTYGVAFMFGEFAFGRLSDRLGRKPVLTLGLALFTAQFIGLVLFRDPSLIVASFVVAGLGNALYDPALSAAVLDLSPPDQTSTLLGIKSTSGSIGNLLGPALVVLLTTWAGPREVFLIATALIVLLTLASGVVLRLPGRPDIARHRVEPAAER